MHSAPYSEKKVIWLVKLVVIMIINDSNSKRGVSRERRCMFWFCVIERHLQVAQCREAVWVGVGWLCQHTYFPRAKHSSLTVMPLAASTVWGKCASILGSYSPITPKKNKTCTKVSIHIVFTIYYAMILNGSTALKCVLIHILLLQAL